MAKAATKKSAKTQKAAEETPVVEEVVVVEEADDVDGDDLDAEPASGAIEASGEALTEEKIESLRLLASNRSQIFSAQRLYEAIWDEPWYYGANNTVMVHIRNLRQKIEKDPKNPVFIKTAWGRGYHFE